MTWAWFEKYCSEAYALVSKDWLSASGVSPSGFDLATLESDLKAVSADPDQHHPAAHGATPPHLRRGAINELPSGFRRGVRQPTDGVVTRCEAFFRRLVRHVAKWSADL
jgi:hypothetical protein